MLASLMSIILVHLLIVLGQGLLILVREYRIIQIVIVILLAGAHDRLIHKIGGHADTALIQQVNRVLLALNRT